MDKGSTILERCDYKEECFKGILAVCPYSHGRLIVGGNYAVHVFDENEGTVTTLFTAETSERWMCLRICCIGDAIYASTSSHKILQFKNGKLSVLVDLLSGFKHRVGQLAEFNDVEFYLFFNGLTAYEGNLYASDSIFHCIVKISPSSGEVTMIAGHPGLSGFKDGNGKAEALFVFPELLAPTHRGLLCCESNPTRIRAIDLVESEVIVTTVTHSVGFFCRTFCTDASANFYVSGESRFAMYNAKGGDDICYSPQAIPFLCCTRDGIWYGQKANKLVRLGGHGHRVCIGDALQLWVDNAKEFLPRIANGVLVIIAAYAWFM